MRQREKAEHCGVWDLVVKRLTMQMEECRINTDIVSRERKKVMFCYFTLFLFYFKGKPEKL